MSYYKEDNYRVPKMVSVVEPYVYEALQSVRGKHVVVQTTHGNVRGIVKDVKPDHIVIMEREHPFFVRIQQIVWIMPD
ncbi:uncharacterized protein DUF2642 [Anoxybacillus vitaminiphilus]|uniref:Uncharacterized protein DUF2642 n=1 Tax=Paranoxybacillus vitaminiphilus TaxID=581036 RepID=A0A327Y9S0_9BACL|nr:YuzF family protein [Anoxybacillus vitaminiphilus]RAK17181.1 uncharacterized protein DUF2642 [Anoxybacillus vitaminiphilus]